MDPRQQQFLQNVGMNPAQIEAIQAQAMAARAQQGQSGYPMASGQPFPLIINQGTSGMNSQQQQILQSVGINSAQIEAIQAQVMAVRAQQGQQNSYGQSAGDYAASGYSSPSPSGQSQQPINLTFNRDASGGLNISGLENLTFVQTPSGMAEDGRGGGTIQVSSPFKDVHGFLSFLSSLLIVLGRSRPPDIVYTPFLVVFQDGTRLGYIPDRNTFAVNVRV
jgi:hypothetical protein